MNVLELEVSRGRPMPPLRARGSIHACMRSREAWPRASKVFRSSRAQSDGICGAQLGASRKRCLYGGPALLVGHAHDGLDQREVGLARSMLVEALAVGDPDSRCSACACSKKQLARALLPMPGSPVRKTSWRCPERAR